MKPAKMFARALLKGEGADPLYLVFFVTEQCTARCGHCLLGQWDCATDELTLDEIERWARAMPPFYFLLPTGGEPFLRADLPDIVRLFARHCGIRHAGIPTNGSLPQAAVAAMERMIADNPDLQLAVDVSLDGPADLHDRMRNTPGLFDKAVATYSQLAALAARAPNFQINAAVTLSAANQTSALDFLDYLTGELGVRNINHLLVRGEPRDPNAKNVSVENYKAFNRKLEQAARAGRLPGYRGYAEAGGINAMKLVRQDVIARTAETGRRQVRCQAGRLGAVVRAGGGVYACELRRDKLGSLRDSDFDFRRIWRSPEAVAARRAIEKQKCHCTYECFMSLNVMFDPVQSLRVARKWVELKAQDKTQHAGDRPR
jgi:MoaA/NifB/PqqE/SkfB family radical SAM enzyme